MPHTSEKNEALRLLRGIENGTLATADAYNIAEKLDPILLYFLFRYLREKYPLNQPNSTGVVDRLVNLTSSHDDLIKRSRIGEKDAMREWFDDSHNMREFFASDEGFVDLIVEKLEG